MHHLISYELFTISDFHSESLETNFRAIKTGDLDQFPSSHFSPNLEIRSKIELVYNAEYMDESTIIEFFLEGEFPISGMQFALSEIGQFEVVSGDINLSDEHYHQHGDHVRFSWNQDGDQNIGGQNPLFTLIVNEKIDALHLADQMNAEAYGEQDYDIDLRQKELASPLDLKAEVLPNPFDKNTRIAMFLPDVQDINFAITDLNGKVVYESRFKGVEGMNQIDLDRSHFDNVAGIYIYTISAEKASTQGRIILQ